MILLATGDASGKLDQQLSIRCASRGIKTIPALKSLRKVSRGWGSARAGSDLGTTPTARWRAWIDQQRTAKAVVKRGTNRPKDPGALALHLPSALVEEMRLHEQQRRREAGLQTESVKLGYR